jgi:purine-binding chemotaxis protein CheW
MVNKNHTLSGEEALDEYFNALLNEEWQDEFFDEPAVASESAALHKSAARAEVFEPVAEVAEQEVVATTSAPELQRAPLAEAKVQPDFHPAYTETEPSAFEVPDLNDVQKLLDKLEAVDHAAEPDIVTIIEQNTAEIAKASTVAEATQPVTEALVADEVIEPEVEEIQEWVVETPTPVVEEPVTEQTEDEQQQVETELELQTQSGGLGDYQWDSTQRDEAFQVLYFDVNGVTFAVPLDELGGIHRTGELSHLIGRPGWYLGLQTSKDDQLDVVDTAKWVMAERLKDESYKEEYKYIVMLGLSKWGLASTELKGTESLDPEMVRWRETSGKRPWLAGMVKEKMCALIHVEAMVTMLNAGLDVKSLDS